MSVKAYLPDSPEIVNLIKRYQAKAPVDIVGIAKALGINVYEGRLGEVSGKIFLDNKNGGNSGYSILINENEPQVRRRFTVAHEVAHFLLHKRHIGAGIEDDVLYRSGLDDRIETDANRFAAELLMPVNLIHEAFSSERRNEREVAKDFQVSETALKIRLGMPT